MVSSHSDTKIKQQIEYYMSDANLSRDKFFREQISTDKQGWVAIAHFLNCNKVKMMSISSEKISEACTNSTLVEVSKDKKKIRRTGNPPLPELNTERKRDAKAGAKSGAAA